MAVSSVRQGRDSTYLDQLICSLLTVCCQEATGALGLACSMQAAEDFGRQLSRPGQAEKTFLALVCADTFALKESSGIIRTELECRDGRVSISGGLPRYEGGYRRLKVMGKLREDNWTKFAVTSYEVVARSVCPTPVFTI